MFYILCPQQLLHLSTILLMKWLAFTFGTSIWQIGGICYLITWTLLINEAGLSSCRTSVPVCHVEPVQEEGHIWSIHRVGPDLRIVKSVNTGLLSSPTVSALPLDRISTACFQKQLCDLQWIHSCVLAAVSRIPCHLNHIQSFDFGGPI